MQIQRGMYLWKNDLKTDKYRQASFHFKVAKRNMNGVGETVASSASGHVRYVAIFSM